MKLKTPTLVICVHASRYIDPFAVEVGLSSCLQNEQRNGIVRWYSDDKPPEKACARRMRSFLILVRRLSNVAYAGVSK